MALQTDVVAPKSPVVDGMQTNPFALIDVSLDVALSAVADALLKNGVLLYDSLEGRYREAADLLISGRAVDAEQDESGFVFMKPLPLIVRLLRGQNGPNYILRGLASRNVIAGA